jgi:AcrR family transcriptional regulator
MRSSLDPRAARTRQAIIDAVHVLVGEEQAAITVGAIVEQAQVSRSSFYTQFAGIDELALSVLNDALDDMGAVDTGGGDPHRRVGPGDPARQRILQFLQHLEENRALYTSVLSLPFSYLTYTRFIDTLAGHIAESIEAAGTGKDPVNVRFTSTFVAGGVLATVRLWLQSEPLATADDVVEELLALLPSDLSEDERRAVP